MEVWQLIINTATTIVTSLMIFRAGLPDKDSAAMEANETPGAVEKP
ncbi:MULTISPECIES: low affinity iron permease family protein [Rhizobium/Agrobacterium group]|nr:MULTISPECIES: low affinity iron permease family protein [Rhizobium/Agrobacterium group]MDX8327472.1 low affinity iron permease family protein [Agrobacterium tumefaciens]